VELSASAKMERGSIQLRTQVKDTGIGISIDQYDRIFEYFTQVKDTDSRYLGGSGLGLSIVKNLVELSGGTIAVESEPGKGSIFAFIIPYRKGEDEDLFTSKTLVEVDGGALAGLNILVADDQPYNLELSKIILEKWGCKVTSVSDGAQALSKLHNVNYDAALLDVQMPELSGPEVVQLIKEEKDGLNQKTPFIAVTAGTDEAVIRRLEKAGFVSVLPKPFTEYTLFQNLLKNLSIERGKEDKVGFLHVDEESGASAYQLDELAAMAEGDMEFLTNMLQLFVTNTEEAMESLSVEISKKNGPGIATIAHKTMPPCRHLKLQDMVDLLSALEKAGNQNDMALADHILKSMKTRWRPTKVAIQGDIARWIKK
jgi:CheY-like chemotaxis protein